MPPPARRRPVGSDPGGAAGGGSAVTREIAVRLGKNASNDIDPQRTGRGFGRAAAQGVAVLPAWPRRASRHLGDRRPALPRRDVGIDWLPEGGFLGVEVFFVISGYLITALLLAEYRNRAAATGQGRIDLKRSGRAAPAGCCPPCYLLLATVSLYWFLFIRDEMYRLRGEVLAAITYVTNWYLIFSKQSYFDQAGRPSPFRHLWSLAVEEQFYLIWPLLFLGLLASVQGPQGPPARHHPGARAGLDRAHGHPLRRRAPTRPASTTAPTPGPPGCSSARRWPCSCRRGGSSARSAPSARWVIDGSRRPRPRSGCSGSSATATSSTRSSTRAASSCCRSSPPWLIARWPPTRRRSSAPRCWATGVLT